MPTKANEDAVHKALREWSQAIANRKGAANRSKKLKAKAELKKKIDRLKADAIEDMDDEDEELAYAQSHIEPSLIEKMLMKGGKAIGKAAKSGAAYIAKKGKEALIKKMAERRVERVKKENERLKDEEWEEAMKELREEDEKRKSNIKKLAQDAIDREVKKRDEEALRQANLEKLRQDVIDREVKKQQEFARNEFTDQVIADAQALERETMKNVALEKLAQAAANEDLEAMKTILDSLDDETRQALEHASEQYEFFQSENEKKKNTMVNTLKNINEELSKFSPAPVPFKPLLDDYTRESVINRLGRLKEELHSSPNEVWKDRIKTLQLSIRENLNDGMEEIKDEIDYAVDKAVNKKSKQYLSKNKAENLKDEIKDKVEEMTTGNPYIDKEMEKTFSSYLDEIF